MNRRRREIPQAWDKVMCLKELFYGQNPDMLIDQLIKGIHMDSTCIEEQLLSLLVNSEGDEYTHAQLRQCAKMFTENSCSDFQNGYSIFYALGSFSNEALNNNLRCGINNIQRWHKLSSYLAEDLLVCSKQAICKDATQTYRWPPFVDTDCESLNVILDSPLADIHNHLKGSSLNFDINWICLMNNIQGRENSFNKMDRALLVRESVQDVTIKQRGFYHKALLAAAIRLMLFEEAIGQNTKISNVELYKIMKFTSPWEVISESSKIQREIEVEKVIHAHKFDTSFIDYAIHEDLVAYDNMEGYEVLYGERFILHNTLKQIYSSKKYNVNEGIFFYIYLLIKSQIRSELTQLNANIGFDNFNDYEIRKTLFIDGYPEYEELLKHIAVSSFFHRNPTHRLLETRIAPKNSEPASRKAIDDIMHAILSDKYGHINISNENFAFIYHFIKFPDGSSTILDSLQPRHCQLRDTVKKQAYAIKKLRQSYKSPILRKQVGKVVGIDAANSEISCRPEVFAQAFRFLRDDNDSNLGVTYHVGEDFIDIVDGLRAVDELITFMNLRRNDRLGHALVLGEDVEKYYCQRHYVLYMTQQMKLDNLCWLYMQLCGACLRNKTLVRYLLDEIDNLTNAIYSEMIDPHDYFQSWLLRGDAPYAYKEDGTVKNIELKGWFKAGLNHNDKVDSARCNIRARKLYYRYHFDENVKLEGAKIVEIKYEHFLTDAIKKVQRKMLEKVQKLGLVIECNPTSNLKIGDFERYDEHPIAEFYNKRLKFWSSSGIPSTINTDDKGIFSTSIEREYALMYAALQRKRTSATSLCPKRIDKWLEDVRKFSLKYTFIRSNSEGMRQSLDP